MASQIACRSVKSLEQTTLEKIANSCQVDTEQVVVVKDMPSIYQVPLLLEEQGLVPLLRQGLDLDEITSNSALIEKGRQIWSHWTTLTSPNQQFFDPVTVALVGKYVEFQDSYLSVIKSLEHSAMRCRRRLIIKWVDSEALENSYRDRDPAKFHKAWHDVCTADGILVPGGFGLRGTEGMIAAAKWARENKKPYLGICLGMQIAVIEYARNVANINGATSEEFRKKADAEQVIVVMPEIDKETMGETMRLGRRPTHFQEGTEWSKMRQLYGGGKAIDERHRHRFEVNPKYIEQIETAGLQFVGKGDENKRMEIVEIKDHPWFVGVQFHPEYLSRVLNPSKPYLGFVAASSGCLAEITQSALDKNSKLVALPNGVNGGNHF